MSFDRLESTARLAGSGTDGGVINKRDSDERTSLDHFDGVGRV